MADVPTELLVETFDIVHQAELYSDTRSSIRIPLALSHVCRHWREVILDLPHHWTHVHLSHTHHPFISREIFRRSKSSPLFVSLGLANSARSLQSPLDSKEFLSVISDPSVTSRLRDLRITGHNLTISRVARNFGDFPALQNLVIRQVRPSRDHHYVGPFTFNPKVFKTLTLEGIGIHCSQSSVFSGLQSLTLVRAAESILNQTTLLDYNHPATPYAPCMTQLSELRLIGTLPPVSNPRARTELYSPSFDQKTLAYLYLSDYESEFPSRAVRSSLNSTSLEELELENVRGLALGNLIDLINEVAGAPLPFSRVHTLTVRNTPDFSRSMAMRLLRAFSQLRVLRLRDLDVENFAAVLRDTWICPLVSSLLVDGVEIPRPAAINMIAPPA